jgi:fatty acid desaturase
VKWLFQIGKIPDLMGGGRADETAAWKKIVAKYQQPPRWRSTYQIINSLILYTALSYLIYLSLAVLWWIALPPAILAEGFLVRLLSIHHYRLYA